MNLTFSLLYIIISCGDPPTASPMSIFPRNTAETVHDTNSWNLILYANNLNESQLRLANCLSDIYRMNYISSNATKMHDSIIAGMNQINDSTIINNTKKRLFTDEITNINHSIVANKTRLFEIERSAEALSDSLRFLALCSVVSLLIYAFKILLAKGLL